MARDFQNVFAASRFSKHLRVVDRIDTGERQRGHLYEVVTQDNIGAGKSGRSCRTKRCRDFALRVYDIRYSGESHGLDPFMLRQSQGLGLNHPNLLKFYDIDLVFQSDCKDVVSPECSHATMLILMELASGNLRHWMNVRRRKASIDDVARLGFDMLNGLAYLHHRGFVHRRMHPSNVMMVEVNGQGDHDDMTAKIGDFQDLATYEHTALPILDEHSPYTAPEILLGHEVFMPESDIWSVGVILFEMLVGVNRTPFMDSVDSQRGSRWFRSSPRKYVLSRIFQWLGTPTREWREKYTRSSDVAMDANEPRSFRAGLAEFFPEFKVTRKEEPLMDLIERCLTMNPEDRISAVEALRHPAFRECLACRATKLGEEVIVDRISPSIPKGLWYDIRTDIIGNVEKDVQGGFMPYYAALMAIYIFDQCPKIFAHLCESWSSEFVYSVFCACYLLGLKLTADLPTPPPDLFEMSKGIVCGASEANRVNILFLERAIVAGIKFRFDVLDIMAIPCTMSIFQDMMARPFRLVGAPRSGKRHTG